MRGKLRGALEVVGLALMLLPAAATIYAAGVAWLMAVAGFDAAEAALVGVVPFLPGEVVKLFAAAGLMRALNSRVRRSVKGSSYTRGSF